jgi:hypothetical protein
VAESLELVGREIVLIGVFCWVEEESVGAKLGAFFEDEFEFGGAQERKGQNVVRRGEGGEGRGEDLELGLFFREGEKFGLGKGPSPLTSSTSSPIRMRMTWARWCSSVS